MPRDNAGHFLQNVTPHTFLKWAAGPCGFGNFQLKILMSREERRGNGESEVVQRNQGLWFHLRRMAVAPDVVHISAVEKAGHAGLAEGSRVSYELQAGRSGKMSAENLRIG
jgi:hypothetical protein